MADGPSEEAGDAGRERSGAAGREDAGLDPTDEVLIQKVQGGDTAAYDILIGRYKNRLYSVIYHMTSNREDASDLLQETFIRAFRAMPRFRSNAKFSTWAYRIAVNLTINFLRERRNKHSMSLDDMEVDGADAEKLGDAMVDRLLPSEPDREQRIAELQRILNESLMGLSENHRAVVVLHDIEGKTHVQISEILGIPEGTVKTRLFHAHKNLQKKLGLYLKRDKEWS